MKDLLRMGQHRLLLNKYKNKNLLCLKVKEAELQGQFYSAIDLGELAAELDTMERRRMAEVKSSSANYALTCS